MELLQLRIFVAVAKEGALTRAARTIHLSQPALSLQLKSLQAHLGVELFRRTPRGMQLSRAGEQLLPYAQRIINGAGEFKAIAAGLTAVVSGRLRIGTILDPEFLRLGAFLRTLVERHPGIETDLSHGISGWVLSQIKAETLDVGFYLGIPEDRRYHAAVLSRYSYRIVAPPGWKHRISNLGWEQLAPLPWIWTPPESAHNRMLSKIFAQLGVTPNIVAQVDQEPSMLDLVKSGVGLSLLRDSIALQESHAHGLSIANAVSVPAELTFICLRRRRSEPAIASALSIIEELWAG